MCISMHFPLCRVMTLMLRLSGGGSRQPESESRPGPAAGAAAAPASLEVPSRSRGAGVARRSRPGNVSACSLHHDCTVSRWPLALAAPPF